MTKRFAFYGRVSTEDHQDEDASRGWQLRRARQLIEPHGGVIVTEFFDIGQSRSLPWSRRPEATRLLAELADPARGFEAIVVGEPARAFYGNQFSLTFPVIDHHGVELWVPEVGGRVDPGSEAHEMLMSLFGGMSKGERTRVKMRVKAAMADMAEREGRFLGGRPPYGYRLADAGPHSNPEKRAAGVRLHRLEPDPVTGPVVAQIFDLYVGGSGFRAIAQTLANEGVPSPSAHDRDRNAHRAGTGWAFSAVRSILSNPRYTGREVWGRQPRQERLLDPERPADGYVTAQAWADPADWIRSTERTHEPLITDETFERARTLMKAKSTDPKRTQRSAKANTAYLFSGMVVCGVCQRKMAGHRTAKRFGYQCRIRDQYAFADESHPRTLYVSESGLTVVTTEWLNELFAPENRDQVLDQLAAAAVEPRPDLGLASKQLREAERRITKVVEAVSAGVIETNEARTTLDQLRAQKAAAEAALAAARRPANQLTTEVIGQVLDHYGGLVGVLGKATRDEQMAVYQAARLGITYHPEKRAVSLRVRLGVEVSVRVGGGT